MLKRTVRWFGNETPWLSGTVFAAAMLGGCALSQYDYLLFHTLIEISSFVVAAILFAIFWNTRRLHDNSFYLIIAFACLAGGVLDLAHALTYKEFFVVPGTTPDDSIQLKTAGRWILGLSFIVAPFFLSRKINVLAALAIFGGIVSIGVASIAFWDIMPTSYIVGKGMTHFQHVGRGMASLLFLASAIVLTLKRDHFNSRIFGYLLASQIACAASESASAISADFTGWAKVFGHLFQLAAVYLLYKAFVEWGIKDPGTLIFQNLARNANSMRKERDFMDALLQSTHALVVVFDQRCRVVRFNRTCETISGYTFDEVVGQPVLEKIIPPEELDNVRALLEEHRAGRLHSHYDNHWIHKDGDRRLISWSNSIIADERGEVKYIICTGIDNTELKGALSTLERESLRYKAIMEASLDGIYIIDSKGYLLEFNSAFLNNLGYSREEARHLHIGDWNAEWSRGDAMREVRERMERGGFFETVHRRKDGSLMSVEVNATSIVLDGEERIFESVRDVSERKRAQEELLQQERRLQLFAENIDDVLWMMDFTGRFIYVSPSVVQMLGYLPDEFLECTINDFMTPASADSASRVLKNVASQAQLEQPVEPNKLELEFIHKDGLSMWCEVTYMGMYNDAGNLICLQGITRDITERRRVEQSLRESEEKYRLFFEESGQGIILIDFDARRIEFANPAFCQMLGYSEEELKRLPLTDLHPPKNRMLADSIYDSLLLEEGISSLPIPMQRKDGESRYVELSGVMVRLKERKYGVCFFTDVTQRKRAEKKLELAMKRLESLYFLQEMLALPSSLEEKLQLIADSAASLLDLDFCRIWMIRPGDLCDSECIHHRTEGEAGFCSDRDTCLHLFADSRREAGLDADFPRMPLDRSPIGRIAGGEIEKFITDDVSAHCRAEERWWASRYGAAAFAGYKLADAMNRTNGVLEASRSSYFTEDDDAFLEDLAKKATQIVVDFSKEEELRQSQKLEGVGQLAGGVAHEFNNLLQVIEGYTRYGIEGLAPGEQRYDDLQQVLDATSRATTLTKQLLGFSRHKAIQLKSVDANSVVRDLVVLLRPVLGKLVTVQTFFGENVGEVYADAVDLQQALLNLCLNARDAMPSGGILSIRTEKQVVSETFRNSQFDLLPGNYVVYSVTDTGTGIPHDIQQRIFEPFFTTKEVGKGTGLGLSMVYGMVRQHKGAVQVESEMGLGTTIGIYLPAAENRESEDTTDMDEFILGGSETILVAEDDPMTHYYITHVLEAAGYSVLAALDGEEALRIFEENRGKISLAVLDLNMPKYTGEEVCARILDSMHDVKIIFCTGIDAQPFSEGGLEFENIPVVRKPFNPRMFLGKIRELLDVREISAQIAED